LLLINKITAQQYNQHKFEGHLVHKNNLKITERLCIVKQTYIKLISTLKMKIDELENYSAQYHRFSSSFHSYIVYFKSLSSSLQELANLNYSDVNDRTYIASCDGHSKTFITRYTLGHRTCNCTSKRKEKYTYLFEIAEAIRKENMTADKRLETINTQKQSLIRKRNKLGQTSLMKYCLMLILFILIIAIVIVVFKLLDRIGFIPVFDNIPELFDMISLAEYI
jgi:hypothetical protein